MSTFKNNRPKILVTGAKGQLGSEIKAIATDYPQFDMLFADREQMPLDQLDTIAGYLEVIHPNIIINAGAYTAVDKAEEEQDLADRVNHLAVAEMAKWAAQQDAKMLHISTDYVFEGTSQSPIKETAPTAPINWYGVTKLKGEQALVQALPNGIIIRTAWVYSEYGNNFVKTMLRLMQEKPSLNVVNDQLGAPTYAGDLAEAIMNVVTASEWTPGIFHYTNQGKISWFDFAQAIKDMSGSHCDLHPVNSDQFKTAAVRPKYSLLDSTKIRDTYNLAIPDWKTSLNRVVSKLTSQKHNK